jgi:hypothetical protein
MKLKFEINNISVILELDNEDVKEWKMKRDEFEPNKSIEEFICEDVRELVNSEIEDGKYGLFNY